MTTIGSRLKEERERLGVSLGELSGTTKIQVRQLEAIERSAYDELPGEVFAKGYVRSFADALGLDSVMIAAEYDKERRASGAVHPDSYRREREEAARAALKVLSERRSRGVARLRIGWIASSVTIVTLSAALIAWVLFRNDVRMISAEDPAPAATAHAPAASPDKPADGRLPTEPIVTTPEPTVTTKEPIASTVKKSATVETVSQLEVTEFGVGSKVENLTLIGRRENFRTGAAAAFWTRVVGGREGDEIRHLWLCEEKTVMSVNLRVGGSHWRTYSSLQLNSIGDWTVEALDSANRVLARATFTVAD